MKAKCYPGTGVVKFLTFVLYLRKYPGESLNMKIVRIGNLTKGGSPGELSEELVM